MITVPRPGRCGLAIGAGHPVRIMSLIGATHRRDLPHQIEKLAALAQMMGRPDIVSDLSLISPNTPLWELALERGFTAATLPIYTVSRRGGVVDPTELLARATEQVEGGVGLLTIHPTPRRDIINLAKHRRVPWTSRGGGIVITDLIKNGIHENVYLRILPHLVDLVRKRGAVISIGASFRSANIFDALDQAQEAEIEFQLELANSLRAQGCKVIIESPGHARPRDIRKVGERLAKCGHPIMPLGPIPTDAAAGEDHVSAAIGATLMGLTGGAHILAAVTREEHTGGIPSTASTLEAVRSARVAAHVIDIDLLGDTADDEQVVGRRALAKSCVDGKRTRGCERCASACPLWTVPDVVNL